LTARHGTEARPQALYACALGVSTSTCSGCRPTAKKNATIFNQLKQICIILRLIGIVGLAMGAIRQRCRENSRINLIGDNVKNIRFSFVALCLALVAFAPLAFAHHGNANYDTTKSITVKGVVTGFEFVNPHVQITWDAKDDSGTASKWQGELTSPNRLTRDGWSKSSIKPGDTITISGYPTKSGAHEIWIQKVVMGNGEELPTGMGGN